MIKVENYRGVEIAFGVVSFNIRYFVLNKLFTHFSTIEEAKNDIDEQILIDKAEEWIDSNKDYFKFIVFSKDELIQIGKNISKRFMED
jgi:hypothetical protein